MVLVAATDVPASAVDVRVDVAAAVDIAAADVAVTAAAVAAAADVAVAAAVAHPPTGF